MSEKYGDPLVKTKKGNKLYAKTKRQAKLVDCINEHQITVCHGPAGTGKTFVTTCLAVKALINGEVDKIVVTRPAVSAGENLGFLPGDIDNKMDPFLRPIFDVLELVYPKETKTKTTSEKAGGRRKPGRPPKTTPQTTSNTTSVEWSDKVEMVPFAYMRGRTFHNSFIIADEMQNATKEQVRMIMTRIGMNSKMVIDGDIEQTDIGRNNGLNYLIKKLEQKPINDIGQIFFEQKDIVRNKIINDIENLFKVESYKDNPDIISNH